MNSFNVRAATTAHNKQIKQLALDNNMFGPDEIDIFDEMLAGFHDGSLEGHRWLVATESEDGPITAAANYAPEPFSDRMWNLYFIATAPDRHSSGAGTALIEHIEAELVSSGRDVACTLIVETSSLDDYAQARGFYERRGFVEEARIRDYYGPGDNKVTFWKSLLSYVFGDRARQFGPGRLTITALLLRLSWQPLSATLRLSWTSHRVELRARRTGLQLEVPPCVPRRAGRLQGVLRPSMS